MTTYIPFGEWLPDLPLTGLAPQQSPIGVTLPGQAGGIVTATNVIPGPQSYLPFPSLAAFSSPITARCQGGIFATDAGGVNYNYVGDATKLYVNGAQSYNDATRLVGGAYTVAAGDFWEFCNWGNTVIGVNGFVDVPQQITLGGANFANLVQDTTVKAKHITTMRDFVVMGNISDAATNVYRIRWCGINDPTKWTTSAANMADFQDLPSEGGPVQKVLGGEYGVVLQQRSIWRMLFVGSPLVFQFDRIHNQIGAYVPQAAIRYQNQTYFLATDGFYEFDGSNLRPIGRGKVDQFFLNDLSVTNFQRINAAVDPTNKLVMWAYPSSNTVEGNPDKLLVYSWAYDRWSLVTGLNIQYFMQTITTGYTLEGLNAISTNLDTGIPSSLDSIQWTGGQVIMAAFDSTNSQQRFNGSAMAATLETGEFQLFKDRRTNLNTIRPDVIGLSASYTLVVVNRNNLTESASVGTVASGPNLTGLINVDINARYFRIRLVTSALVNFTHILGVEVDGQAVGRR